MFSGDEFSFEGLRNQFFGEIGVLFLEVAVLVEIFVSGVFALFLCKGYLSF